MFLNHDFTCSGTGKLVFDELGITSSRPSTPPEELEENNLKALFIFPAHISLCKDLARATLSVYFFALGR